MTIIKFIGGKDKRSNIKRAIEFYYDNFSDKMRLKVFLAKCRVQDDKKTIHFYPTLHIDLATIKRKKKSK